MDSGYILQILMILTGVFLFCITLFSLARRRMTEPFVLTWGFISIVFIFAGILLRPANWKRYISPTGMLLTGMVGLCMLFGAYFMSVRISELMRKNLELAMQAALMKQEIEEIKMKLSEVFEKQGSNGVEKETTFHEEHTCGD